MKKKILILANNAGGLYDFRNELLLRLLGEYEVHVSLPDAEEVPELEREGCIIHPTALDRRGINPFRDIKLLYAYYQLIKKLKPAAVLTYTIKPNIYGGLCCRLLRIRYIVNITGLGSAFEKEGLLKRLVVFMYRTSLKRAGCIFFQNDTNRDIFKQLKVITGKSRLLPGSGVNLTRHKAEEYPDTTEKIVLLFAGRLMREKGTEELLYTAKKIHMDYPEVIFKIAGTYEEDYKSRIEEGIRAGYIVMEGYQKEIHPYYKEAWAVLMPSYHEGMNNVILEAAATARPVLASNIPGCREGYEEGITGLGFLPADKEDMYRKVKEFLQLPYEEKRKMGQEGRRKMEKEFDRRIVVEAYMEEIRANVIDGRK